MEIEIKQTAGYFGVTGIPHYQPLPAAEERGSLVRRLLQVSFTCDWLPPEFQERFAAQIQATHAALYAEYQAAAEGDGA